jgi:transcriptional regulator with XRE-family HTH domain
MIPSDSVSRLTTIRFVSYCLHMAQNDSTRHNGYAIRALREARGMSVQDLCNRLTRDGRELSAPALRNIELENREAKVDLIQRIATTLEVPIQAITRVPLTEWQAPRRRDLEAVGS